MQTSLRRQRRRRLGDRHRPRGNGANAVKAVAVAIPKICKLIRKIYGAEGPAPSSFCDLESKKFEQATDPFAIHV